MAAPSPSTWPPSEIVRFLGSIDSGTEVARVLTDVGEAYLKAMGNKGGEHCLACEWVGSHLARWFKLPTLDFAIINVTEADEIPLHGGKQASPGPAFITRAEFGESWSGKAKQLHRLINPNDISRLVAFDTWILNCDRHAPRGRRVPNHNNVFLSTEAPEGHLLLKAIDHTHAFTCGKGIGRHVAYIDNIKDDNVYGLFPSFATKLDPDSFQQAQADLASVPSQLVEQIVSSIPREWDVGSDARSVLTKFIVERAQYLAQKRTGTMGICLYQRTLNFRTEGGG
jgi:hypothetical protein